MRIGCSCALAAGLSVTSQLVQSVQSVQLLSSSTWLCNCRAWVDAISHVLATRLVPPSTACSYCMSL